MLLVPVPVLVLAHATVHRTIAPVYFTGTTVQSTRMSLSMERFTAWSMTAGKARSFVEPANAWKSIFRGRIETSCSSTGQSRSGASVGLAWTLVAGVEHGRGLQTYVRGGHWWDRGDVSSDRCHHREPTRWNAGCSTRQRCWARHQGLGQSDGSTATRTMMERPDMAAPSRVFLPPYARTALGDPEAHKKKNVKGDGPFEGEHSRARHIHPHTPRTETCVYIYSVACPFWPGGPCHSTRHICSSSAPRLHRNRASCSCQAFGDRSCHRRQHQQQPTYSAHVGLLVTSPSVEGPC